MGQPKPLVKLGRKTMLQRVLANMCASQVGEIVVVLGHRAEEVVPTLKGMDCNIVVNPQYAKGMSSSLGRGLGAVDPRAQAVLIALGDKPYIPPAIIDLLIHKYEGQRHEIVVPTYGGRRGHPVIFGRKYWPELRALKGDVGGKELLRRHAWDVLEVEVPVQGVLTDIDEPRNSHQTSTSWKDS